MHVYYCSQLWSQFRTGEIQQLELIQRSFIRKIQGAIDLSYWDQLQKFKLKSLQRRRERYWPMINNLHGPTKHRCFQPCETGSIVLHFSYKEQSFPEYSSCIVPSTVHGCSVDAFKNDFLRNIPDEPQIPGYTICRRAKWNSLTHMAKHKNNTEEHLQKGWPSMETWFAMN